MYWGDRARVFKVRFLYKVFLNLISVSGRPLVLKVNSAVGACLTASLFPLSFGVWSLRFNTEAKTSTFFWRSLLYFYCNVTQKPYSNYQAPIFQSHVLNPQPGVDST